MERILGRPWGPLDVSKQTEETHRRVSDLISKPGPRFGNPRGTVKLRTDDTIETMSKAVFFKA